MGPPKIDGVHRAMESALARGVEGLHALPEGVLLADRDRSGRWGKVGAYYAYCLRCGAWLNLEEALAHGKCSGRYWDEPLARAAAQWAPELEKMAAKVRRGEDPYYGFLDLRSAPAAEGGLPQLSPGRRQLVRLHCPPIGAALEAVVDVPPPPPEGSEEGRPLKVLVYFHGHGEDCRQAPPSADGLAVLAAQCPREVWDKRCFWFQEGHGGAWERHEHAQLSVCAPMLEAASLLVDQTLLALAALRYPGGVEQRVAVMGVSMGAHATLEFARSYPERVGAVAAIAGYYEEAALPELVDRIADIPLLLVHRRDDRCCPFGMVERLHEARLRRAGGATCATNESPLLAERLPASAAVTEAWFSDGARHGPTDEERDQAVQWLLDNY